VTDDTTNEEDPMKEPVEVPAAVVKRLRDLTGAGMMDCKRALTESSGDLDKAQEILRTKGLAGVEKRKGRTASQGLVDSYIHAEGRIGVLVEVNTETDFVARTDEFRALTHEIALQVAAGDPRWVMREEVPEDVIAAERKIAAEKARQAGKPEAILDRIVDGAIESFFKQFVLLEQAYVREPSKTVRQLVEETAAKVGENVVVRRFTRYQLGEEA
jgi:elongation factor Ts